MNCNACEAVLVQTESVFGCTYEGCGAAATWVCPNILERCGTVLARCDEHHGIPWTEAEREDEDRYVDQAMEEKAEAPSRNEPIH